MMINPDDPLSVQIQKQQKIITALMSRVENSHEMGGSAYALFQSAVALESKVRKKTQDLETALSTLGKRNSELKTVYSEQIQDQQSLADTLEVMNEGYALYKEGRLAVFNERFRTLLPDVENRIWRGMPVQEFLGLASRSAYLVFETDEQRGNWKAKRLEALGKQQSSFVMPLINDRWFQAIYQRTSFGNIAVLLTDITSLVRKNRLEKNRIIDRNTVMLQAMFEHLNLAVCMISASGRLLLHNQKIKEIFNIPDRLLKEKTPVSTILKYLENNQTVQSPPSRKVLEHWVRILPEGTEIRKDFTLYNGVVLDMRLQALPDGDIILSFGDITLEKKAEAALKFTNETLEENVAARTVELVEVNQKLKERARLQKKVEQDLLIAKESAEAANLSKTRFLAAASHDLLQPINAAKLYTSILMEEAENTELLSMVQKVSSSFSSIESLLQSLLEISRLDAKGAEFIVSEFPMSEILEALENDFKPFALEKDLDFTVIQSSYWVRSDKNYLRRVMQNLVTNAVEYTLRGRILVGCRKQGETLLVQVWDTGIGISKKNHGFIFEEFSRLNKSPKFKGMGLGLSIVERVCHQLGHQLTMRSKPNVGSVFTVALPIVRSESVQETAEIFDFGPVTRQNDLIAMVIENDETVLDAMTQTLENWGISVLGANSTLTALREVSEVGLAPDIIIADYQLDNDDNGLNAITELRAATKSDVPAIMVTASSEKGLVKKARDRGVEVLFKPVPLQKLRALISWRTSPSEEISSSNQSL